MLIKQHPKNVVSKNKNIKVGYNLNYSKIIRVNR